jgi:CubicO group peptidase (beta-lactamase class C family)
VSETGVARSARHGHGTGADIERGGAAAGPASVAGGLRKNPGDRSHPHRHRAGGLAPVLVLSLIATVASAQTPARLNAIARAQADSGFSGVVLVARDTTVIMDKAFSPRSGRPLSTQSQFNIGSMTKGFTAAAILRLRSQHRLSFSDPISRFFPFAPEAKRGITVFHLLTHTSGLQGHSAGSGIVRRDGAVNAILAQPLDFPPGTQYRYMDDDYQLLAAIVEVASGLSWEDYITRELLQPARMWSTGFQGGDWGHKGANGMRSTARDMFRWLSAIHHEQLFGRAESHELESPLMHVRSEPPYEIHYGYGARIYVRNGRIAEIMHSGSGDANQTSIARLLADGTSVIVLSSGGPHRGTTWASYVAQKLVPRR